MVLASAEHSWLFCRSSEGVNRVGQLTHVNSTLVIQMSAGGTDKSLTKPLSVEQQSFGSLNHEYCTSSRTS